MTWLMAAMAFALGAALAHLLARRRERLLQHRSEQSQQVLREFRAMVESANDGMLLVDRGRIVECNPAAQRLYGMSREQLIGMHPAALSPETQPGGENSMALADRYIEGAMSNQAQRFLWRHLRAGEVEFTAEVALSPLQSDDRDDSPRFVSVMRDVTEPLRAAEAVQASERRFRRLFELAPIPLALTTPDGALLDVNRQWSAVLGYDKEDVPTMDDWWRRAYPEAAYRAGVKALWDAAMHRVIHEGAELRQTEVRLSCKDGSVRTMRVGGALVGGNILTSYFDVTEQKQAQAALEALNSGLEARVAARTQELQGALENLQRAQAELVRSEKLAGLGSLVAGMAHELNTPIGNAVIVASTLADQRQRFSGEVAEGLRKSALTRFMGEVEEGIEVMERNLRRAAELLSGFKQVAVDQSNHQRREFDLQELMHELSLTLSPTLRRHGVALNVELPAQVRLDSHPGPLSQVLMNVINNAVVHAFERQPSPQVHVTGELLAGDRVRITLKDNGCGIEPQHLPRVFDPFFTTRLGKGGSGLGMHIVYSLVTELLGGTVHIDSTVGVGTTVTLELPLHAPTPQATAHASHE